MNTKEKILPLLYQVLWQVLHDAGGGASGPIEPVVRKMMAGIDQILSEHLDEKQITRRMIEKFLDSGGISSGYVNTLGGFQEWLDKEQDDGKP